MKSFWLAIIFFSSVLAQTENSDDVRTELDINYLESVMENSTRSLKSIDYTEVIANKVSQIVDVMIGGTFKCPSNVNNGVYKLQPFYSTNPPFSVFCENGWIVIHRRFNGSLDFNQNWSTYREGFGDLQGEFWLGLEKVHQITRVGTYQLKVVMKNFSGKEKTAQYDDFKISSEFEQYRLDFAKFTGGTAGDSLTYHKSMKFSTPDNNNDYDDCAEYNKSGWWFQKCYSSNLNGIYEKGRTYRTMSWYTFHDGTHDCLMEARMMIRPVE